MRRFGYRSLMRTAENLPDSRPGKTMWCALPIIISWFTACTMQPATSVQTNMHPIIDPDIAAFMSGWQAYADEIDAVPRQNGCRARFMPAAPAIPRKGAVVMFHGFGGCPQQFFELGRLVSAQGFDVILPLLPGHGAKPELDGNDDLSRLPTADDWEARYAGLARRINEIMARSPGTRVIVGFSLGGAISLNANMQAPALYDRHLLLSPMFAIRGGAFVEGLAGFLGRVPGVRNIVVKPASKRQECRDWESAGRAGFCDYQLKHVVALLQLEEMNRRMYRESVFTTPIQIVAAGDEDYVSNEQIVTFVEQQAANGPISLCFMPADVRHEMLSPFENSDLEMYWLGDLLGNSISFITNSGFFPQQSAAEETTTGSPPCRIHAPQA
jgi:alpha-beta hydrolase superfamily lysophospholipase